MILDRARTAALASLLLTLRPKRRRRVIPKPIPTTAIELSYWRALGPVSTQSRDAMDRVSGEIMADLSAQRKAAGKTDAKAPDRKRWFPHALPGPEEWKKRSPALDARRALHLAAVAQASFQKSFDPHELNAVVKEFGRRTNAHQRAQLDRQVRAAIGVPYGAIEKPVRDHVDAWTKENVALIKTVPERYFARIRSDIEKAYSEGTSTEELAKQFSARHGQSLDDARRIARTSISQLNGQLNRERQRSLGITKATWRTAQDNRVRDCHTALEGTEFSWDEPPMGGGTSEDEEGFPGSGINCRCYAEPDFSGVLGED